MTLAIDELEADWIKQAHVDPLHEAAQPRVPAGSTKGGQFASAGGGAGTSTAGATEAGTANRQRLDKAMSQTRGGVGPSEVKARGATEVGAMLDKRGFEHTESMDGYVADKGHDFGDAPKVYTDNPGYWTSGKQYANAMQSTWAQSAADSHPVAIQMQHAASKEFGLQARTDHLKPLDSKVGWVQGRDPATDPPPMSTLRTYARARYDHTQASLAAMGVTGEVTLYRGTYTGRRDPGTGGPEVSPAASTFPTRQTTNAHLAPLSSWSTSIDVAESFGDSVMTATFPVKRIFGTALTGSGALTEHEVIVIGGSPDPVSVTTTPRSY
jgi:hypothetical protein